MGGTGKDGAEVIRVQATGEGAGIAVTVPSGQEITLIDVIPDAPGPSGLALRFRFLAPAISAQGGTVDFETASADMADLCQNFALPRLPATGPQPDQVIISLSDRVVPFGEAAPDATQYFEAYRIENGVCIWEPF